MDTYNMRTFSEWLDVAGYEYIGEPQPHFVGMDYLAAVQMISLYIDEGIIRLKTT